MLAVVVNYLVRSVSAVVCASRGAIREQHDKIPRKEIRIIVANIIASEEFTIACAKKSGRRWPFLCSGGGSGYGYSAQ